TDWPEKARVEDCMHCANCGVEMGNGARFCPSCGGALASPQQEAVTAVATEWPSANSVYTTTRIPSPPLPTGTAVSGATPPKAASAGGRPGWLIPVLGAATAVVALVVAAGVYLVTRSSARPSFNEQATAALAPVIVADQHLSLRLA